MLHNVAQCCTMLNNIAQCCTMLTEDHTRFILICIHYLTDGAFCMKNSKWNRNKSIFEVFWQMMHFLHTSLQIGKSLTFHWSNGWWMPSGIETSRYEVAQGMSGKQYNGNAAGVWQFSRQESDSLADTSLTARDSDTERYICPLKHSRAGECPPERICS